MSGNRWLWGNLFVKSVSPHPFQKLFLRILRMLRFLYVLLAYIFKLAYFASKELLFQTYQKASPGTPVQIPYKEIGA